MDPITNTPRHIALGHRRLVQAGLLILVSAIILYAGLRPYGSFHDRWVDFDPDTNSTQFKGMGVAFGELSDEIASALEIEGFDLHMRLIPATPNDNSFHVIAQLDSGHSDSALVVGQWRTHLITINGHDFANKIGLPRTASNIEEFIGKPIDIRLKYLPDETILERNGLFMNAGPAFQFTSPLSRISIGNTPAGDHGWTGKLITTELSNSETGAVYDSYQFTNNALPAIANASPRGKDLTVPALGRYPDTKRIERLEFGQLLSENLQDVVINLFGFVPFGLVVTFLFVPLQTPKKMLIALSVACCAGVALSAGIELSQTRIAGRNSHMHDLVLNTLGAFLGCLVFLAINTLMRVKKSSRHQQ